MVQIAEIVFSPARGSLTYIRSDDVVNLRIFSHSLVIVVIERDSLVRLGFPVDQTALG